MTPARIPLLTPLLDGNESMYLQECIASTYVSSVGPFVQRFEDEFARWNGVRHAVACASGTAACHLCLVDLGVGPGSEVLVSDLTFIASANPIRYCGAEVTLVDSEPDSWNLDARLVAEELDRRRRRGERQPAAIVAVHVLGQPAALEALLRSAAEHNVPVIEDAAEALGGGWTEGVLSGRKTGCVGELGFFSFNGNKVLTSGGGGMVVTADARRAERIRHLSMQARVAGWHYDHDAVGFNYRLTNLAAAVGLAQLERLDSFLRRKREIASAYDAIFSTVRAVTPPPNLPGTERSAWLYSIVLSSGVLRDRVAGALEAIGIESRPVWRPLHLQPPYRDARVLGGGTVAEDIAARGLSLPSSVWLSDPQIAEIAGTVVDAVGAYAQ